MASLQFESVALADESEDFPLFLLTLSHDSAGTLRFVNDNASIESDGNTYHAREFSVAVQEDTPSLTIDNANGTLDNFLDSSGGRNIAASIKMILRSRPEVAEFSFDFFAKSAGRSPGGTAQFKLTPGFNLESISVGKIKFTKAVAPGLF